MEHGRGFAVVHDHDFRDPLRAAWQRLQRTDAPARLRPDAGTDGGLHHGHQSALSAAPESKPGRKAWLRAGRQGVRRRARSQFRVLRQDAWTVRPRKDSLADAFV